MSARNAALALGVALLLTLATPAFAAGHPSNLSLSLSGAVLSAGTQAYSIQGGHLVNATVLGLFFDHSAHVTYSVAALVNGLTVSGSAAFDISQSFPNGTHIEAMGSALIVDAVPGVYFPLTCTPGVDCTSQIPSGFVAVADVSLSVCHGDQEAQKCSMSADYPGVPMVFESSYLNPFGGPIFFGTGDGQISVVATYTQSRVTWTGIQLGGTFSGSLAGAPVTGEFGMTVNAVENLNAGYELDHGTISFLSDNPAVTASGTFSGASTIPTGEPCPPSIFPPGTCQITGFSSSGVFSQTNSLGHSIVGKYSTIWDAPAIIFSSTVSATVK